MMSTSKNGKLKRLLYFDLETTGWSKSRDRIIEIGLHDPQSGASFGSLVNPGAHSVLSARVEELTSISDADLRAPHVPSFAAALDSMREFVGEDATLCAHNGRAFDAPFLVAEMERAGIALPPGWLFADSLLVLRRFFSTRSLLLC